MPGRSEPPALPPTAALAVYGPSRVEVVGRTRRPYPSRYVESVRLRDGSSILVRPIRADDEPLMVRFHEELGEDSVLLRYAGTFKLEQRIDPERLARRCDVDYDREMALVAEVTDEHGGQRILGVGRLIKVTDSAAEFGLVVADAAQRQGLGTVLLSRLIRFGREEGLARIEADIAARNHAMQHVAARLGFAILYPDDLTEPLVRAVLHLDRDAGAS